MRQAVVLIAAASFCTATSPDAEAGKAPPLPGVVPGAVWTTEARGIDARSAALLVSGQQGGAVDASIAVLPPRPTDAGCSVPFWIEVRGIDLLTGQAEATLAADVFVYALNDAGAVAGFWGRNVQMTLAAVEPRLAAAGLRIAGSIASGCQTTILRYLVRNRSTAAFHLGATRVPTVEGAGGFATTACFFAAPAERWLDVPANPAPAGAGDRSIPIAPTVRPVVGVLAPARLWATEPSSAAEIVSVSGLLHSPAGSPLAAGEIEIVATSAAEGGGRLAELAWRVADVEPGAYLLELALRRADGTNRRVAPVPVVVADEDETGTGRVWAELPSTPTSGEPSSPRGPVEGDAAPPRRRDVRRAYVRALQALAAGHERDALGIVDEAEAGATTAADLELIGDTELRVAERLAGRDPAVLVPLMVLHLDLVERRSGRRDYLLATHATQQVARLAAVCASRCQMASDRTVAAGVLASLADRYARAHLTGLATDLFRRSVDTEPLGAALLGLGALAEWEGRYGEATSWFRRLVRVDPGNGEGRLRLAVNLARLGQGEQAERLFEECLALGEPDWVRTVAYQELARSMLAAGRTSSAVALLNRAIEELPDEPRLRLLLAHALEESGDLVGARNATLDVAEAALNHDRRSPRLRYASWPAGVFDGLRSAARRAGSNRLPVMARALAAIGERDQY